MLVQPIDEFNRPAKREYGTQRIPPSEVEVEQLFNGGRESLGGARKFLPAARDYMVASLWRRVGTRMTETLKLDIRDWRPDLGDFGKLHVRHGKGSRGRGRGPLSIQETPDARFRVSDVLLLSDLLLPVRPLLKLLAHLDLLDDDRTPGVFTWFRERTVGLPEPMLGELTTWFELKLSGSTTAPRVKARPPRWIRGW